ncbi:MAG: stage II sporulation protein R [Lachnospiraceae bacterium]
MISKKTSRILVIAIVAAGVITGWVGNQMQLRAKAHWRETQQHMAQEVLRFHVLANSDSKQDQALKMQVKEAVLSFMSSQLTQPANLEETRKWAIGHCDEIEKIGRKIIKKEGYQYPIKAEVNTCHFPDKTYGDVTFPAGNYQALRIEIGEAKGQNWWCVLYPNLCFIDATNAVVPEEGKEELKTVLSSEEYELVTATSDFKIKWFFFGEN